MSIIVNSRADLDAIKGTQEYVDILRSLRGSALIYVDTAVYPEGYGDPSYDGPEIDPKWGFIENTTSLDRLGLSLSDVNAEIAALDDTVA